MQNVTDERESKLRDVLTRGLPTLRSKTGNLQIGKLAKYLGCTRQNLYRTMELNNSISASNARMLIELEGSKITADQILPFIR